MKTFLIIVFAAVLTGCLDGGSGNTPVAGTVKIVCAEAANAATATHCNADAPALLGITTITAGDVSRGQMVEATMQAENTFAIEKVAYIEMTFDAGCNGADTWGIMPKQPVTIAAMQSYASTVGGQCGDMALGSRTLTATLYDEDAVTVMGSVVVSFNLVE